MLRKPIGARRRGFAMLLLAVAAASICTVTTTTQGSSTLYEQQTVRQHMRNQQGQWMLEAVTEVGLAAACTPGFPLPNPPIFATNSPPRTMAVLGYNAGPAANAGAKDAFGIRTSALFGVSAANTANMDIQVLVYSDYRGTPAVEREISLRNVQLEDDPDAPAGSGAKRVKVSGSRSKTAWASRDANYLQ